VFLRNPFVQLLPLEAVGRPVPHNLAKASERFGPGRRLGVVGQSVEKTLHQDRAVFKRVRRESPASYLKVCAMLVTKEMKIEHQGRLGQLTDEQLTRPSRPSRQCWSGKPARARK
jgi:hypothetical protein